MSMSTIASRCWPHRRCGPADLGCSWRRCHGVSTSGAGDPRCVVLAARLRPDQIACLVVERLVVEQQVFVERTELAGRMPDRHLQNPQIGLRVKVGVGQ